LRRIACAKVTQDPISTKILSTAQTLHFYHIDSHKLSLFNLIEEIVDGLAEVQGSDNKEWESEAWNGHFVEPHLKPNKSRHTQAAATVALNLNIHTTVSCGKGFCAPLAKGLAGRFQPSS